MRSRTRLLVAFLAGASLLAARGFVSAAAQPAEESLTAKLGELWGSVLVRADENAAFQQAELGQVLQVGAQIQTDSTGKARVDFSTGTVVRVGPDTLFTLQPAPEDSEGTVIPLQLVAGKLWVVLRGGSFEVETETGVASVSGSMMTVNFNSASGKVRIICIEGHCALTNAAGEVQLAAGQTAEAFGPDQPPKVGQMTTQDCQDWQANNPGEGVGACGGGTANKGNSSSEGGSPPAAPQSGSPQVGSPPAAPQEPKEPKCATNCGVASGGNGSGNEGDGKGPAPDKVKPAKP
jgi:hypothetical protein